ncbi:MAG TPA: OmpA family protein [bacterium]
MKVVLIIVSVIALLAIGAAGVFYSINKKTQDRLGGLSNAIDSLTIRADNLEEEKNYIANALAAKIVDISKEKEEEIERLKFTHDELVTNLKKEIEDGQIKITRLADRLSVSMVDKILFPSGEADITPAGLKILERVGKVLKNTKNKIIRVEGHTDNVAIKSPLQEKFPTNWELSTARATNVVRFLQDKVGVEPVRLEAIGMSEYHPVVTNKTPAGRSRNRRIEINLMPDIASGAPPDTK